MENELRDLISEHVLLNEENLRMTVQIVTAFNDIREKLITEFLSNVKKELLSKLDSDWVVQDKLSDNVFEKCEFSITKKTWKRLYFIGFAPDKKGAKDVYIGVYRQGDKLNKPLKQGMLTNLLNENYKKGNCTNWWDWWQYVDSSFRNWDEEESLVKMYYRTEFVSYFVGQIINIKDIVEAVIDKEIKTVKV